MKNKLLFVIGAILVNSYLYASPFTITLQNKGENISLCPGGLLDKDNNEVNLPVDSSDNLETVLTTERSPYMCVGNVDGFYGSLSITHIVSKSERQDVVLSHSISVNANGLEVLKKGSDGNLEWNGQRKYYCFSNENCNLDDYNNVIFTQWIEYKGAKQPTEKTIKVHFY